MPCCASTLKDPTASMTDPARVVRSGWARGSRPPSRPLSLRRPRPERDEGSAWPLVDLCEPVERSYGVALQWCGVCPACWTVSTSHARTPVRPTRRAMRPRRQRSTKQLGPKLQALAAEHPDQRLQLWGEEEARIGETRAPHPGLVRARHAPARSCRSALQE